MNTQYNQQNTPLISMHSLKTAWNSLGAADKDKNDVTSACPAVPKVSENVCH